MSEKKDPCLALKAEENAAGHHHGHIHEHMEAHFEPHMRGHICPGHFPGSSRERSDIQDGVVTIRSHSGLSGDIMLSGLAILHMEKEGVDPLGEAGKRWFASILDKILPGLGEACHLRRHAINGIGGWQAVVELPHEHEHRNLEDIDRVIADSAICAHAKDLASRCFHLLAECEGSVHNKAPEEVHFHEVGALDSILDICSVCELYCMLNIGELACSPLPMSDGRVACAHGLLPSPAPASLRLLKNVAVRPFEGGIDSGELVTPTALALLHTLKAHFGHWPAFHIQATALVYGQKEFTGAPNGIIFAFGER